MKIFRITENLYLATTFFVSTFDRQTKVMSLEQITITVDEQWVRNLVEKLQKYEMFTDQHQKIIEAIKTAEADEQAAKRGAVTQNMVELFCEGHGIKLVQREDLVLPEGGPTSLSKCPGIWIKPFGGITGSWVSLGTCASHTQCTKCQRCIDGAGWVLASGKAICTDCRVKSGKVGLTAVPKQYPSANVNRPKLCMVRKVVIKDDDIEDEEVAEKPKKKIAAGSKTAPVPKKKVTFKSEKPPSVATTKKPKAPVKAAPKKIVFLTDLAGPRAAKTSKKTRDPDAPKRPISGYMAYGSKRRPQLKRHEPDLAFGELTKKIAAEWDEMSEKEKKPYLKLASEDKARYQKEKEKYEQSE